MELLLFDKATFSEPLIFQDPYFFKVVIHFRKCYFLEDAVYWKMLFSTANLIFTVTRFICHLVINPGVFRNSPVCKEWCTTQKMIPFNIMNKNFVKNLLFRVALNRTIYRNMWKFSFWGVNKNVNSSTEFQYWISKITLYDKLFLNLFS